jgi:hypothetical protein
MDKADAVIIGADMDREERLLRMDELLDKEDFSDADYKELRKLINEMENERRRLREKYAKTVYNIK